MVIGVLVRTRLMIYISKGNNIIIMGFLLKMMLWFMLFILIGLVSIVYFMFGLM